MNTKHTALDAYPARSAAIHAKLERLQQLAGNVVLVRGLRGAASDLAWWLRPVSRLRFQRRVIFLPESAALACQTTIAAQQVK